MIETFEFYGHTVVGPILGKDQELSRPYEDYFVEFVGTWLRRSLAEKPLWVDGDDPIPFIEFWFEQERETLWDIVLYYFDCKCLCSSGPVETGEVHELITRGAAGNEGALVPWNMIPLERTLHQLFQEYKWKMYHYDPLDYENGLVCFDTSTHRVANENMFFYHRLEPGATITAQERRRMILDWARNRVHEDWKIAPVLALARANKDHKAFGEPSHKAMLAGMQFDGKDDKRFYVNTGLCNSIEKALELAIERNAVEQAQFIEPPFAVRIMKRVEDEKEMLDFLVQTGYISKSDWQEIWNEKYKNAQEKDPGHRDAIEAVCECGEAHLRVHRHVLQGDGDEFGFDADYTVDNGEAVHANNKVEVVTDEKESDHEQDKEEAAVQGV